MDREQAVATRDENMFEIIGLLRQASAALDTIWREAMTTTAGESVIRLGEASHGVHRALIALSSPRDLVGAGT